MGARDTDWIAEIGKAMAYPEEVPAGATEFTFVVDGRGVRVREAGGRRIASCVLAGEDKAQVVAYLAGLAAGRMMKDEATLAWDAEAKALVLWQEVGKVQSAECSVQSADGVQSLKFNVESAGERSRGKVKMVERLEEFLNALDWWMGRVEGGEPAVMAPSEFIIRP